MKRLAWLDSLGVLGGESLLSFLLVSAVAFSALSFVALRKRGAVIGREAAPDSPELQDILRFEPSMLNSRGERLDVAAEANWALAALAGRAARKGVRLELAISPGLALWMDPRAFRKLLVEIAARAIGDAACGRVLLTGCRHGGRVQIGISHDGPPAGREELETALRPSTEIAALNGGTLEVSLRTGQGATVLVRMPEPAPAPAPASEPAAASCQIRIQKAPEAMANP
jgi:hypothetical protein